MYEIHRALVKARCPGQWEDLSESVCVCEGLRGSLLGRPRESQRGGQASQGPDVDDFHSKE